MKKNKYRLFYEKLKEAHKEKVDSLKETMEEQSLIIDQVKAVLSRERVIRREIANRLDKIENDGRALTMENLMTRWHEIKLDTDVLWITTPNISILNHGTMANITDRLKRLCPHLKLILFTSGDIEVESLSDTELKKLGLQRIDRD